VHGDDGEITYVLEGNKTILKDRYDAMWNPPKGVVNMKARDKNPDGTKNWI